MSNTRIQFDLNEDKLLEIQELMYLADVPTRKAYLDNAFTLLKWALNQAKDGKIIAALDEKGGTYRELSMPPLDNIRRRSNAKKTVTDNIPSLI